MQRALDVFKFTDGTRGSGEAGWDKWRGVNGSGLRPAREDAEGGTREGAEGGAGRGAGQGARPKVRVLWN